jgi:hypothetical protein
MEQDVLTAVVQEVADAKGVEADELKLSLYDHIETDAVVQLLNAEKGNWQLSFDIPDFTVTVWSDGSVAVEPPQQAPMIEHP